MTFDDIDRLEAGRDADALLAELIPLPGVKFETVAWEANGRRPYWRYVDGGFREKFRPTTEPDAAGLILDWLRSRGVSDLQQLDGASELEICKAALRELVGKSNFRPTALTSVPAPANWAGASVTRA